ncbi:SDR family oxidoreductase [Cysteiniphilum halobium]|uniref:SDR family oxidoreductase n=1 Tax=Cysteiniphilum halobium TaxID=2219059 RepID=UPI001AACC661|nr:SDR family oxidoreductase [Cysteiniphilum halobium]
MTNQQAQSMRLSGKKALVTAAGQGIGKASAIAMAKAGAQVIASDINIKLLQQLQVEHPEIQIKVLDVLNNEAIQELSTSIDTIDILFNCAGFVHHGTILDCTDDEWDFSFNLNVKSMFHMNHAFLPKMLQNGGGSIINMASIASSVKGAPNRFLYGATKAAVIGMTKSLAIDFITQGIRVNAIAPATVESPSWEERVRSQGNGDPEQTRRAFIARQPIGRIGKAEEIAALVVYLASDESSFTTGTVQIIDGGWSI